MTEAEIYEKLTEIARDIFDDDQLVLTPQTTAAHVEDWDSLSHINFVITIEGKFGIKFKSAELEGLKNIGELVEAIQRHLQDK